MERLPKLDIEAYVAAMKVDFEQAMRSVGEAVNAAPTGHVISGSEEKVRDTMAEFRARAYQRALQMRVDAAESAFSPGRQPDGQAAAEQGQL